eukprot:COSAG05_NODE_16885_length_336_cov_1.185654_1_plen_39_part_01
MIISSAAGVGALALLDRGLGSLLLLVVRVVRFVRGHLQR